MTERHGLSDSPRYMAWLLMIRRCHNETADCYASYGGRGIQVCPEWRKSFGTFHKYITALPGFGESGLTLDRIDNDGNYEPGNVRWATKKEQMQNRRSNRLLTYQGETKCLAQWAEELGVKAQTITYRLKSGWSVEKTLSKPVNSPRK